MSWLINVVAITSANGHVAPERRIAISIRGGTRDRE
jgi:hypothetical protein